MVVVVDGLDVGCCFDEAKGRVVGSFVGSVGNGRSVVDVVSTIWSGNLVLVSLQFNGAR